MENANMKYRPILFSTPMVKALDQAIKTQTRRTKGLEVVNNNPDEWKDIRPMLDMAFNQIGFILSNEFEEAGIPFRYHIGDVFWVRETFHKNEAPQLAGTFYYKAMIDPSWDLKWKPSLFMPKEACRIFLKIKAIRIERLNDISEEDAINEGILFVDGVSKKLYYNYQTIEYGVNAIDSYMSLWEKINGKDSWGTNPYVFVYEFEHIEKPLDFK